MIFVEKIAKEKRNFLKKEEYKYRMKNIIFDGKGIGGEDKHLIRCKTL